ncbi:hypothetical protein, partial [Alkalibacillus haloalkaliphilus]|uniref:hypothetical protein n=1 Tax=Alkalibacillus haloalkaliphilus TaxID=94136 RepID=UPI002935C9E4
SSLTPLPDSDQVTSNTDFETPPLHTFNRSVSPDEIISDPSSITLNLPSLKAFQMYHTNQDLIDQRIAALQFGSEAFNKP